MKKRRLLGVGLAFLFFSLVAVGIWFYVWLFHDLPHPQDISNYVAIQEDARQHIPVSLQDITDDLQWATLSVLDPQFYARPAEIRLWGVMRGVWHTLTMENWRGDGASLTEYLVLDLMSVSDERVSDFRRQRMREMVLGVVITQRYTKDEILEMYLNSTSYGSGVYGVGTAAHYYFGKQVRELSLAESAMLVAICWMGEFDEAEDLERAVELQEAVLELMTYQGCITEEEAWLAGEEVILFAR